jgi:nucleoside 2-deoxyribosyltransferase
MPKRFFVSARKDRNAEADALSAELKKRGWQRTYEWNALDDETPEELAKFAIAELDGVSKADVLIVLLPGGFGTHVEIGAALALGKPVILHSPDQKTLETPYRCPFHYHPKVKILISATPDVDAILACVQ